MTYTIISKFIKHINLGFQRNEEIVLRMFFATISLNFCVLFARKKCKNFRFFRDKKRNFCEIENAKFSQKREKFRKKCENFTKNKRKLNFLAIGCHIIKVEQMYYGKIDRNLQQIANEIKISFIK